MRVFSSTDVAWRTSTYTDSFINTHNHKKKSHTKESKDLDATDHFLKNSIVQKTWNVHSLQCASSYWERSHPKRFFNCGKRQLLYAYWDKRRTQNDFCYEVAILANTEVTGELIVLALSVYHYQPDISLSTYRYTIRSKQIKIWTVIIVLKWDGHFWNTVYIGLTYYRFKSCSFLYNVWLLDECRWENRIHTFFQLYFSHAFITFFMFSYFC